MSFIPGVGNVTIRPAAVVGPNANHNIFTVTGMVVINYLVGQVTVVMDATASTLILSHSVGPTNLCAVLAAIANDPITTNYTITGTLANNMVKRDSGTTVAVAGGLMTTITVPAGNIYYTNGGAQTGFIQWSIGWIPLIPGSTVVAA
ncbi:MAG: hypothetical protein ACYDHZ_00690 [Dehalococcoidia bacterium]